jgi:hypothetical protein
MSEPASEPTKRQFEAPKMGEDGKFKTLHHPEGIPQDEMFFNEEAVSGLILKWRDTGDILVWQEIVKESLALVDTLILDGGFTDWEEMDALRSECVIKLSKVIEKFDPKRGRAFTIFSISIKHFLISYSQKIRSKSKFIANVEDGYLENLSGDTYVNQEISPEFKKRVMGIETRFNTPNQRDALKYYVTYFLNDGFFTSKIKMCTTASLSFGLTMDQAYILYDYALIKLRSELIDMSDMPPTDIELLRLNKRWSLIPEMAELIGLQSVEKLVSIFGGVNITFPSPKDLVKLRQSKNIMMRSREDPSYYGMRETSEKLGVEAGPEFERLTNGVAEGDAFSQQLFESEGEETDESDT